MKKQALIGFRYIDSLEVTIWHKEFESKKKAKKWIKKTFNSKEFDTVVLLFASLKVDVDVIVDLLK